MSRPFRCGDVVRGTFDGLRTVAMVEPDAGEAIICWFNENDKLLADTVFLRDIALVKAVEDKPQ